MTNHNCMSIVHVISIVLAAVFVFVAVFSVALYKIVMQCSLTVYYGIYHLSQVGYSMLVSPN